MSDRPDFSAEGVIETNDETTEVECCCVEKFDVLGEVVEKLDVKWVCPLCGPTAYTKFEGVPKPPVPYQWTGAVLRAIALLAFLAAAVYLFAK